MGWNDVVPAFAHPLIAAGEAYYLHGYHFADAVDVAATSSHGTTFTAAVAKDNIVGVQFHPEKSQAYGLATPERFLQLRPLPSFPRSPSKAGRWFCTHPGIWAPPPPHA